jgi:hypothetical protein
MIDNLIFYWVGYAVILSVLLLILYLIIWFFVNTAFKNLKDYTFITFQYLSKKLTHTDIINLEFKRKGKTYKIIEVKK